MARGAAALVAALVLQRSPLPSWQSHWAVPAFCPAPPLKEACHPTWRFREYNLKQTPTPTNTPATHRAAQALAAKPSAVPDHLGLARA
eukprot:8919671-Alexandrium_andersonii.AAC.1